MDGRSDGRQMTCCCDDEASNACKQVREGNVANVISQKLKEYGFAEEASEQHGIGVREELSDFICD
jgi:hypothetical protein